MLINTFPYFHPCVDASWAGEVGLFWVFSVYSSQRRAFTQESRADSPETHSCIPACGRLSRRRSVESCTALAQCLHNGDLLVPTPRD